MKLEVTKWVVDFSVNVMKQFSEFLLRSILFLLPLGVYMFLLEYRNKVSKISNLLVYTKDHSVWQHVFPGFILVAIDPGSFKNSVNAKQDAIHKWIEKHRYVLSFLFALILVSFMLFHK